MMWLLFVLAAGLAAGFSVYVYRRRETAVRHRGLLATLRALALVLLLLVLFDPALPASSRRAIRSAVALDASLSMRLPVSATDTTSRWRAAVARARDLADDRDVLVFGSDLRATRADSLGALQPDAPSSRLLPAVRAAAEAGVRRLVVLTDGGIEDGPEVARWLARYGIEVEYEPIGDGRPLARALVEVEAPAWAEAGAAIPVRIATGPGSEPARLRVTAPGQEPLVVEVPAAAEGRLQSSTVQVTPAAPPEGGLVRIDVAASSADSSVRRSVYVHVGEAPGGVALVSLTPDWEPRFLVPVLETALGLPVRAFLRAADGTFIRIGGAAEAGARVPEEEVRRAAAEADLLVLHGAGGSAPGWSRTAAERVRRLLVFPADAGAAGLPVRIGGQAPGEFYVSADLPASPIAPLLDGLALEGLPPLTALATAERDGNAWAPLLASPGRRGELRPVVLAGEAAGRRWAVALGSGYWRWAFRDEPGRAAYARLWGALAGWLLREESGVAGAAVRPASRSVPQGVAPAWLAAGLAPDSLRVVVTPAAGGAARTGVARGTGSDTVRSAVLPPGDYAYAVTAFTGDSVAAEGSGPLTVEPYSPELARTAVDLDALRAAARPAAAPDDGGGAGRAAGRPLRASPAPWLLIIALLAAEWILRRRWGLR